MIRHTKRPHWSTWTKYLLSGLVILSLGVPLFYQAEGVIAQTVSTPIPRYLVMDAAADYCWYPWFADADSVAGRWWSYSIPCWPWQDSWWYTSAYNVGIQIGVAYKWGGGDYVNNQLTPCNNNENFGQRIANTNDLAGDVNSNWYCGGSWKPTYPGARGVDCSGYVTRVWGRPTCEKWGTWQIPDHAAQLPGASQAELRRQMRMGDVFDDPGSHVVLLHYFDPTSHEPIYYESTWGEHRVIHNTGDGWGGVTGYGAYRYDETRDDSYLPTLRSAWSGWYSTIFARNNYPSTIFHAVQHTVYGSSGGDTSALASTTRATTANNGNDTWQVSTGSLAPSGYHGGGVVAADTGTSTAVDILGNGQTMMYTGIPLFSSLGLGTGTTLYFPVFTYNYYTYVSKAFVQNAGTSGTNVRATYYYYDNWGNSGTCTTNPVWLEPWGIATFDPADPNDGCSLPSPSIGALRVSAAQPLAAVEEEYIAGGPRRGAYNAFSAGASTLYAPNLLRDYYDWYSGVHFHNLSGSSTTLSVTYYRSNGTQICTDSVPLSGNGWTSLYQGGDATHTCLGRPENSDETIFSARMSAGQSFVAVVNQDNSEGNDFQVYNALPSNEKVLVLPYIRRDSYWDSDLIVQNTSSSSNAVKVSFYSMDGQEVHSVSRDVTGNGWWDLYGDYPPNPNPPYGFKDFIGSVVVEGSRSIAVNANLYIKYYSAGQDAGLSYSGMERKSSTPGTVPGVVEAAEEPSEP